MPEVRLRRAIKDANIVHAHARKQLGITLREMIDINTLRKASKGSDYHLVTAGSFRDGLATSSQATKTDGGSRSHVRKPSA